MGMKWWTNSEKREMVLEEKTVCEEWVECMKIGRSDKMMWLGMRCVINEYRKEIYVPITKIPITHVLTSEKD